MHEKCENAQMTQQLFADCSEKVLGLSKNGDQSADAVFQVACRL